MHAISIDAKDSPFRARFANGSRALASFRAAP